MKPSPLFPLLFWPYTRRESELEFIISLSHKQPVCPQLWCESGSGPLFHSCRMVPRAAGKKVGAGGYPLLPRAAPRDLQLSRGWDQDRPLPSTPKASCPGAWLHFHYVFMMPSALSRNHSSCLALLKYPGKWSNNQITSLTEWQILE